MPELPEVETIKLGLQKKIVGLTLTQISVLNLKTFQGETQELLGKKIREVWRKGKMLGIDLGNLTMLFHLKMTGQLVLDDRKERLIGGHPTPDMRDQMPNKSTRVIFTFSSGEKLYFNDQRKFGWVKVLQSSKIKDQKELIQLGPDPLEDSFTWDKLKNKLLRHKSLPIKLAIMDQSTISGVGNIYASEALFRAKLDPRKKVADLSDSDFKNLYLGIKRSLENGIKHGGSTLAHFVNIDGEKGYFLDYASVYGKAGQTCKICKGIINKITLGGRGTYFCPTCQK